MRVEYKITIHNDCLTLKVCHQYNVSFSLCIDIGSFSSNLSNLDISNVMKIDYLLGCS